MKMKMEINSIETLIAAADTMACIDRVNRNFAATQKNNHPKLKFKIKITNMSRLAEEIREANLLPFTDENHLRESEAIESTLKSIACKMYTEKCLITNALRSSALKKLNERKHNG